MKVTHRRKIPGAKIRNAELCSALGMVVGAVLYLVGSIFFWPHIGDADIEDGDIENERLMLHDGAICFLTGSVLFFVIPLIELFHQHAELGNEEFWERKAAILDGKQKPREALLDLITPWDEIEALKEMKAEQQQDPSHPSTSGTQSQIADYLDRRGTGATQTTQASVNPRVASRSECRNSFAIADIHMARRKLEGKGGSVPNCKVRSENMVDDRNMGVLNRSVSAMRRVTDLPTKRRRFRMEVELPISDQEKEQVNQEEEDDDWNERARLLNSTFTTNLNAPIISDTVTIDDKLRAYLYSYFIIRCEWLVSIMFATGGLMFSLGSAFFLPEFPKISPMTVDDAGVAYIHGAWLFLCGTVVFLCAAGLALFISHETNLTKPPLKYNFLIGKHFHHLYWLNDEEINIASCCCLLIGNGLYVPGTILFFPGYDANITLEITQAGDVCFIIGSCFFVFSALLDFCKTWRGFTAYTMEMDHTKTDAIRHAFPADSIIGNDDQNMATNLEVQGNGSEDYPPADVDDISLETTAPQNTGLVQV